MLTRLLEPVAYVAICGSLIFGSYHAGKLKERQRIWAEIATKSASVRAAMTKLDADADDFEATLVRLIGEDDAKLSEAEGRVVETPKPAAVDSGDPCRPVPAACLRRQGPYRSAADRSATSK